MNKNVIVPILMLTIGYLIGRLVKHRTDSRIKIIVEFIGRQETSSPHLSDASPISPEPGVIDLPTTEDIPLPHPDPPGDISQTHDDELPLVIHDPLYVDTNIIIKKVRTKPTSSRRKPKLDPT